MDAFILVRLHQFFSIKEVYAPTVSQGAPRFEMKRANQYADGGPKFCPVATRRIHPMSRLYRQSERLPDSARPSA